MKKTASLLAAILAVILIDVSSSFSQRMPKNLYEKLKILSNTIDKKDTAKDGQTADSKRFIKFMSDRLDTNGNGTEYARYFANRYARMSTNNQTKLPTSTSCYDNCDPSCLNNNWRYVGPENIIPNVQVLGMVSCIWVNPADHNHIRAGAKGGLWETRDGGVNWTSLTDKCLSGIGVFYIASPDIDPTVIYISTGIGFQGTNYGYGVYKSTNGGGSWVRSTIYPVSNVEHKVSSKIIIHPVNSNIVYCTIGYEVYKSINSGSTWNVIFNDAYATGAINATGNINKLFLRDIEIVTRGADDDIYISSEGSGPACYGVGCTISPTPLPGTQYYTATAGAYSDKRFSAQVWKITIPQGSNTLLPTPQNISTTYSLPVNCDLALLSVTNNSVNICAYTFDILNGKIYRKSTPTNTSTPFVFLMTIPSNVQTHAPWGCTFDVSGANDDNIYFGGSVLYKRTLATGLNNFLDKYVYGMYSSNPNIPHVDIRCLAFFSTSSNGLSDEIYFGTDGGISKSTDGGATFVNLNGNGLQLSDVWGISNSEKYPNYFAFGTQDNGGFSNKTQYWDWNQIGDSYDGVSDVQNPFNTYVLNWWYGITNINTMATPFYLPSTLGNKLFLNKSNDLFIASNAKLYRVNLNSSSILNPVINSFAGSSGGISGLSVNKVNTIAYVAFSTIEWGGIPANFSNVVYKITGLSSTPILNDITSGCTGISWCPITDLTMEPILGNKLWVTHGGIWDANKKVMQWQSNTWSEYGQGLPNIPANVIKYYEGSNDLLFVGTDEGVYYRDATMASWQKLSCNLPLCVITDLEINYKLNKLRASTFGRGVWETSIPIR